MKRRKEECKHWLEILVMAALVASSQYPRDRVLWILTEHGGKMERSRLRSKAAMRYAQLNPILDELVKEGRIRISGEIITVVNTT
jgi:predicted transcriptional regulator